MLRCGQPCAGYAITPGPFGHLAPGSRHQRRSGEVLRPYPAAKSGALCGDVGARRAAKVALAARRLILITRSRPTCMTAISGSHLNAYDIGVFGTIPRGDVITIQQQPGRDVHLRRHGETAASPRARKAWSRFLRASPISTPAGNRSAYVIDVRAHAGPETIERYRLSDDGKQLLAEIESHGGNMPSMKIKRVYDRLGDRSTVGAEQRLKHAIGSTRAGSRCQAPSASGRTARCRAAARREPSRSSRRSHPSPTAAEIQTSPARARK